MKLLFSICSWQLFRAFAQFPGEQDFIILDKFSLKTKIQRNIFLLKIDIEIILIFDLGFFIGWKMCHKDVNELNKIMWIVS